MTSSPDLLHELRAARPAAPTALRVRVREIAAQEAVPKRSPWPALRARRFALVALPAAAALALTTAGVLGLARSDTPATQALRDRSTERALTPVMTPATKGSFEQGAADSTESHAATPAPVPLGAPDSTIGPTQNRAQRVSATLTVEVSDSDGVSESAQKALDLTRRLGGHVVSASVVTGEGANAAITVRVPVARVQEAVVQLSALGSIVSQQVSIEDLQQTLDALERRERSVRSQIAVIVARLESDSLDAETRARLEARLKNLRDELRGLRRGIAGTNAEARMATIQLTVVTPESRGEVAPTSRLDRTLDEALNVLVWEGVVALAILIVAAPFALVAVAAWLGRRLYRRREDERLLAT